MANANIAKLTGMVGTAEEQYQDDDGDDDDDITPSTRLGSEDGGAEKEACCPFVFNSASFSRACWSREGVAW